MLIPAESRCKGQSELATVTQPWDECHSSSPDNVQWFLSSNDFCQFLKTFRSSFVHYANHLCRESCSTKFGANSGSLICNEWDNLSLLWLNCRDPLYLCFSPAKLSLVKWKAVCETTDREQRLWHAVNDPDGWTAVHCFGHKMWKTSTNTNTNTKPNAKKIEQKICELLAEVQQYLSPEQCALNEIN